MKERATRVGALVGGAGAALLSTAASICCIGPLGIAILGVNGAILAAGLKPYRLYFLLGSLVLIGLAFWGVYGPQKVRPGARCSARAGRVTRVVLWAAAAVWVGAVVIQVLADQYWL